MYSNKIQNFCGYCGSHKIVGYNYCPTCGQGYNIPQPLVQILIRSISTSGASPLKYLERIGSDNVFIANNELSNSFKKQLFSQVHDKNVVQIVLPFIYNISTNKPEIANELQYIQSRYPGKIINVYIVYLTSAPFENPEMSQFIRNNLPTSVIINCYYDQQSFGASINYYRSVY